MTPNMQPTNVGGQGPDDLNDGIDLGALFATWWRQRVKIVLLALAGVTAITALMAVIYSMRPVQQQSTLVFRLLFKGAERGLYPNEMQFTANDIVATPVLEEVFRRNQLEKFGHFDQFKSSFVVINRNPAIERLQREYSTKIDAKLAPVDRQKTESEFESRMRAVQNAEYTLVLQREGALSRWPATLAAKILEDILAIWAEQSRSRGVFKFNLNIYSENLLNETIGANDDYMLILDRMRLVINRIVKNMDELNQTPGAQLVRVGEHQFSLNELQAELVDKLSFDFTELSAIIYNYGLFRVPQVTEAYLNEQLFRLDLKRRELTSRNEGLQRVMSNYTNGQTTAAKPVVGSTGPSVSSGLIPQLSDGFLDRIIELSGQSSDIAFRQDISNKIITNDGLLFEHDGERQIYQRSLDALKKSKTETANPEIAKHVNDRLNEMVVRLRSTLKSVSMLHEELSKRNLQPSQVYSVVIPLMQESVSTLSMGKIAAALLLGWCAYMGMVLLILARRL